jgi:hypothetical protein
MEPWGRAGAVGLVSGRAGKLRLVWVFSAAHCGHIGQVSTRAGAGAFHAVWWWFVVDGLGGVQVTQAVPRGLQGGRGAVALQGGQQSAGHTHTGYRQLQVGWVRTQPHPLLHL